MHNEIGITPQSLKGDVEVFRDELTAIREGITAMFDELAILDSMWDGPANEVFQEQFLLDKQFLESVCKDLDVIASHMEYAHGAYTKCENQVAGIISSIPV